jgi:hypothetical protein
MTKRYSGDAFVQYFEHGTYVGSRRIYCCGASYLGESFSAYWPHTAYFCPVCGDLWGREVLQPEFDYAPRVSGAWVIEKRACAEHGDGQFLCGKLLDNADHDLLTRELLALIQGELE